jgi:hypothetical protein
MKIIHDFFPSTIVAVGPNLIENFTEVTTSIRVPKGGKYLERVRTIVMQDDESKIIMVAADHSDGPRMIFSERLVDLNWSGDKNQDSQALTRSGKIIAFKYVQGCSCGSRLRSFSPYRTMDSIKDPTS